MAADTIGLTNAVNGLTETLGKHSTFFAIAVTSFKDEIKKITSQEVRFGTITKIITDMGLKFLEFDRTSVKLTREFGLLNKNNKQYIADIQKITRETELIGKSFYDNMLIGVAISKELRNNKPNGELVKSASRVSQAFGLDESAAGILMARLSRFSKESGKELEQLFGQIAADATGLGISVYDVTTMLIKDIDVLQQFNLHTKTGAEHLSKAATWAAMIGTNLSEATAFSDSMRGLENSLRMSVRASQLGISLNPMALHAASFGGSPEAAQQLIVETLRKRFSAGPGQIAPLQGFTKSVFMEFGKSLGLDYNKLYDMTKRQAELQQKQFEWAKLSDKDREKKMSDLLKNSQTVPERLSSIYNTFLTDFAKPILDILFILKPVFVAIHSILTVVSKAINKISDAFPGATWFAAIVTYITGRLALNAGKALLSPLTRGFKLFGNKGISTTEEAIEDVAKNAPAAGKLITPIQQLSNPNMVKNMLAASVAMISFGGSLWVISKAFQNFNTVNWKAVGIAGTAMVGIIGAMLTLTGLGPIGAGVIVSLGAVAGAVFLLSKAFQNFGKGAGNLADLGKVFKTLNLKDMISGMKGIGDIAKKYNEPLLDLAYSLNVVATSLERIFNVVTDMNIDKLNTVISTVAASGSKLQPLLQSVGGPQTIVIQIDGKQVARAVVKATERKRSGQ